MIPEQLAEQIVSTVCNNVIVANSKYRIITDIRQMWIDEIVTALRQVKRETWEEAAKIHEEIARQFREERKDAPEATFIVDACESMARHHRRRSAGGW